MISGTALVYLQYCEVLPEAKIARIAGVSRQRIHQLEQRFGRGLLAPSGRPGKKCKLCGKKIHKTYCLLCWRKVNVAKFVILHCETCGRAFSRQWGQYYARVKKGSKHTWCSRKCQGEWLGKFSRR